MHGKRFPYRAEPPQAAPRRRGACRTAARVKRPEGLRRRLERRSPGERPARRRSRGRCRTRCSSRARESKSGHPIAVFGPQTAYFAPQLLMDVDVHGPGIDARGATFAGISLYVLLGHGRDYAWSATSAGQDIIDTFAVPLCEPDGSQADDRARSHYRYHGQCLPIDVLEQDEQLDAERGRPRRRPARRRSTPSAPTLGLVTARGDGARQAGRVHKLRSTYFHEADSALGFVALQRPDQDQGAGRLPARRLEDRLHVQLVLHRPHAHRVLQLGQQPGAAAADEPELPGRARRVRVEELEPEPVDGALHAARARTRRRSTRRTSRTGTTSRRAGYAGRRRQLRLRLDLPLAVARRPDQARHPRRARRCRSPS